VAKRIATLGLGLLLLSLAVALRRAPGEAGMGPRPRMEWRTPGEPVAERPEELPPPRAGTRDPLRVIVAPGAGAVAALSLPPAPDQWEHPGDRDGDGLLDEFEVAMGLDPRKASSFPDGIPDENRLDSKGRTMWEAQEEWLGRRR